LEHPGIAALCIEFYYGSGGGREPLAKLFPDDFSTIVPEHAVAAIMTCVRSECLFSPLFLLKDFKIYNCINEYSSGGRVKSSFSGDNYQHAYEGILHIISLVAGSHHHKQQWEQARRAWAARGM
jgi:hypothetical protein